MCSSAITIRVRVAFSIVNFVLPPLPAGGIATHAAARPWASGVRRRAQRRCACAPLLAPSLRRLAAAEAENSVAPSPRTITRADLYDINKIPIPTGKLRDAASISRGGI